MNTKKTQAPLIRRKSRLEEEYFAGDSNEKEIDETPREQEEALAYLLKLEQKKEEESRKYLTRKSIQIIDEESMEKKEDESL